MGTIIVHLLRSPVESPRMYPDVLVTYSGELWELQPVELVASSPPPNMEFPLPTIEQRVFEDVGVSISEFQSYLSERNLALAISRDVRTRDAADKQQPFRLHLGEGDGNRIAGLQFIEGMQLRGYTDFVSGRRVLGANLRSVNIPSQFSASVAPASYKIQSDGSVAMLLPSERALSWQLVDERGEAVVRERFWVTFQSGEIRVCTSCHGINERDQSGNRTPKNSPKALRLLLEAWKLDPDLVIPVDSGEGEGGGSDASFKLRAKRVNKRSSRGRLLVRVVAPSSEDTNGSYKIRVLDSNEKMRKQKNFTFRNRRKKRMKIGLRKKLLRQQLIVELYSNETLLNSKTLKSQ